MENRINAIDACELAKNNYKEYGKYIAMGRSYPCIYDGAKSSYKRAIYGMYKNKTNKMVKVAELAAYALPYHPHPSSVAGVIIQLGDNGNKLKLMDTQGNWGDSSRHIEASAERYIGGKLSEIAEELLCDSIDYCKFVQGEIDKPEPLALPALLPLCFINGSYGIPSGLPSLNIPTIDINGMIDYYIDILKHKDISYKPKKLPMPNFEIDVLSKKSEWEDLLNTGNGKIRTAPIMNIDNKNVITITGLPKSKTIEHVRKIISKEILLDKVDVRDESCEKTCIVVEKVPHKQCDMTEIFDRLYLKLQSSDTFNLAFFDENGIYVPCSFNKVVRSNINYLLDTHKEKLSKELEHLEARLKILKIIENMKKGDKLKNLFDLTNDDALKYICEKYKTPSDISSKVLQKPLSYLTKEHLIEIQNLEKTIEDIKNSQNNIYEYMLKKYKQLKKDLKPILSSKFENTRFING